jgi:hypothetical protein
MAQKPLLWVDNSRMHKKIIEKKRKPRDVIIHMATYEWRLFSASTITTNYSPASRANEFRGARTETKERFEVSGRKKSQTLGRNHAG